MNKQVKRIVGLLTAAVLLTLDATPATAGYGAPALGSGGVITAFAEYENMITVPLGTKEWDIGLPETLTAAVEPTDTETTTGGGLTINGMGKAPAPAVTITIAGGGYGDALRIEAGKPIADADLLAGVSAADANGEAVTVTVAGADGLDYISPQPKGEPGNPLPYTISYEAGEGESRVTATRECYVTAGGIMPLAEGDVVDSGYCGVNVTWELTRMAVETEYLLTISGTGPMEPITVVSALNNYRADITSVIISPGVTNISVNAFVGCTSLTSVTIPDSVTSIESNAFSSCTSLTSVSIPDGVTSINNGAFSNCVSLKSIDIPDRVTTIGEVAFYGCSGLTSIIIPESVESIGQEAFGDCSGLTEITFEGEQPQFAVNGPTVTFIGCVNIKKITVPDNWDDDDITALKALLPAAVQSTAVILRQSDGGFAVLDLDTFNPASMSSGFTYDSETKTITYNGTEPLKIRGIDTVGYSVEITTATQVNIEDETEFGKEDFALVFKTTEPSVLTGEGSGITLKGSIVATGNFFIEGKFGTVKSDNTMYGAVHSTSNNIFIYSEINEINSPAYIGIFALKNINIIGTVSNIKSGWNAIRAWEDINISGEVSVIINSNSNNPAVFAGVSGGTNLVVTGVIGKINANQYGIYSNGKVTIKSDGVVREIDSIFSGIYAEEDILIEGEVGLVTSQDNGIWSKNGDIQISGTVGEIHVVYGGIVTVPGTIEISNSVGNIVSSSDCGLVGKAISLSGNIGAITADAVGILLIEPESDALIIDCPITVSGGIRAFEIAPVIELPYYTAEYSVNADGLNSETTGAYNWSSAHKYVKIVPYTPVEPTISGPASMSLTVGYEAASSEAFTVEGVPEPTVSLDNTYDGKITWDDAENKLAISSGLDIGTYSVTLTAESVAGNASHVFTLTVAKSGGPAAPNSPEADTVTTDSITLKGIPGAEYRLGADGTWQDSPVFGGLEPGLGYVFYARIKETDARFASEVSEASEVITTDAIPGIIKLPFTGSVTITGMTGAPRVGDVLTADVTEASEAGSHTYLWDGAGNPTDGQTYTVTADDLGKTLTVTIGTANPDYAGIFVSAATEAVQEPLPTVFTVTFNAMGGIVSPTTLTTDENGRLAYLPIPIRGRLLFAGWFSTAAGGARINAETVFTEDTIVFAHWAMPYMPYVPSGNDDRRGGENSYNPPAPAARTAPSVSPTSLIYDRETGGDLTITLTRGGYVLISIANEAYTLDRGDDYTVSGGKITIKEEYLNTLAVGEHTLTLRMSNNTELAVAVTISGSEELIEEPTPIPTRKPEPQSEPQPIPTPASTPAPVETSQPAPTPQPLLPAPFVNPFTDVQTGDWFIDYAAYVYQQGLMSGVSTEPMTFGPNVPVSRGMMVTVLWRMAGSPGGRIPAAAGGGQFTDVAEEAYYYQAVSWAAANGIVSGVGDGLYAPDAVISRQDLAVIFNNYAGFSGKTLPQRREYSLFTDDADIADYARDAIENFFKAMIINGKNQNVFDPKGQATRAEVAAMLTRFMEE